MSGKYVTIPNQSFLRFILSATNGVTSGSVTIDVGALAQLYDEATTAAERSAALFIEDGVVFVRGKAIRGFAGEFVEMLETLICRDSMRLEEMLHFFPGIDPWKKSAVQTLRNLISRQNEFFGDTGVAVLGDGTGNFKIYGI